MGSSSQDPRRNAGCEVNTHASDGTSKLECHRLFGILAKTKRVNGVVLKVFLNGPTSGRASTQLDVNWTIVDYPARE